MKLVQNPPSLSMFSNPGGHYYWEGGQPNLYNNYLQKKHVLLVPMIINFILTSYDYPETWLPPWDKQF